MASDCSPRGGVDGTSSPRWRALVDTFADAVALYDLPAARETAAILIAAQAAGRPMSSADAQIAGTCMTGGNELATRIWATRDFR